MSANKNVHIWSEVNGQKTNVYMYNKVKVSALKLTFNQAIGDNLEITPPSGWDIRSHGNKILLHSDVTKQIEPHKKTLVLSLKTNNYLIQSYDAATTVTDIELNQRDNKEPKILSYVWVDGKEVKLYSLNSVSAVKLTIPNNTLLSKGTNGINDWKMVSNDNNSTVLLYGTVNQQLEKEKVHTIFTHTSNINTQNFKAELVSGVSDVSAVDISYEEPALEIKANVW